MRAGLEVRRLVTLPAEEGMIERQGDDAKGRGIEFVEGVLRVEGVVVVQGGERGAIVTAARRQMSAPALRSSASGSSSISTGMYFVGIRNSSTFPRLSTHSHSIVSEETTCGWTFALKKPSW
jgi:hypothetical protein